MSFPENLDVFFSLSDFADTVTKPGGGTFSAIFDESFFDPSAGETVLDTTQPRLTCKLADLAGVTRKTVLSVKGRSFSVVNIQPDGTGLAVVKLSPQSE